MREVGGWVGRAGVVEVFVRGWGVGWVEGAARVWGREDWVG